jgi:hypothetical protein
MLAGMDILGRRQRVRPGPTRPGVADDDLPGFLESPPGTRETAAPAAGGWVPLASPPPPPEPETRSRPSRARELTAAAAVAVLLIGIATVAFLTSRSEDRPGAAARPDGLAVELAFGGVVLERRPVGVTATYPRVVVTSDGGRAVADVELPTWNCLTADAPDAPEDAGCTPAPTEHARLTSPALTVESYENGGVRFSGRFPTELRPNGSPPEPTGRTYELDVTAAPEGEARPGAWAPATGTLRLGDDSAPSTGGAADRLRIG